MKDVIIKLRTEEESHPEDAKLYQVMYQAAGEYAMSLRETSGMSDDQLIAISTRAMQQLAANATELAAYMGVNLEVVK